MKQKKEALFDKVSDLIFEKALCLISPNYRSSVHLQNIFKKIKANNHKEPLTEKEIDLFLGLIKKQKKQIPAKIISSTQKKPFVNVSKSIRVYIHD